MPLPQEQLAAIEAAIAAQEASRAILGDGVVDVAVAALRAQAQKLRQALDDDAPASSVSPAEMLARLQSYIPRELAAKMRALGRIEDERRPVTVLFADIAGFTALSERLDPEVVTALTNEALRALAEIVYRYEGYIDKFIGDAVMAVFGAPVAHEDDPERALRAALAMRDRLDEVSQRWIRRTGEPLTLHIGVHTGTVIAGNVGSDLRLSYTVMGDTVNTAARLQGEAAPGQILVSRETQRRAQEAFTFRPLQPVFVKGKREPLQVWELLRARLSPDKSRGLTGLGRAFVGRGAELSRLGEVAGALAQGRGAVVLLCGEAGLGKSALIGAWREEIGGALQWLEGRAFVHTAAVAFGPFLDLLRRHAGVSDDDSDSMARARFDAVIDQVFPGERSSRALLAHLLSLRLSDEEAALVADLPPQTLRQRVFAAERTFFSRAATARPTVLVIEDLHWSDASSVELIEQLLPLTGRLPLAIVLVCRPPSPGELSARLRGMVAARHADRLVDIQLAPLSDAQSVEMVQDLLETCDLPSPLLSLLRRRGEGNPLFVEELMRALVERGALVRRDDGWVATPAIETTAVPATLEGLLFARLDRLPERVKRVAQQAAVIGREFLHAVLRQLADEPAQLDAHLARLMAEGLVYERAREPEVDYSFRHALIQEAAYRSLLAPRRRELHRRVGEAMESHFAGRIAEVQGIVGEHFLRGEAWDRAAHYLLAAGDADARIYAGAEARQRYTTALEALTHLPDTEENRRARVDAIVKLDDVSFLVLDPTQALGQLSEAEAILQGLSDEGLASAEDRVRLLRVHLGMGRAHSLRAEQRAALDYVQPVLEAAEAMGDPLLAAGPRACSGIILVLSGRFPEGEERLSRSRGGLEQAGDWSTWIVSACYHGMAMVIRGRYVEGIVELKNAEARAQELNNATGLSQAMSILSVAHLFGGNPRRAADTAAMALESAAQSGDPVIACIAHRFLGWAQSRLGEHEAAAESVARSREVERLFGGHPPICGDWMAAGDVEVAVNAGRAEEALSLAARARARARAVGSAFSAGLAARAEGRAMLLLGRLDEAEARFDESLRALVDCDACIEVARTRVVWGALRRERGDLEGAARHLEAAAAQFAASGAGDELEQARRHLAAAGRISPH